MASIVLPAELVQALGDYLAQRPYREVAGLLARMQQAISDQTDRLSGDAEAPGGEPPSVSERVG